MLIAETSSGRWPPHGGGPAGVEQRPPWTKTASYIRKQGEACGGQAGKVDDVVCIQLREGLAGLQPGQTDEPK